MANAAERRKRAEELDATIERATRGVVARIAALGLVSVRAAFDASVSEGGNIDAVFAAYRNGVVLSLTEAMGAAYMLSLVEAVRDTGREFATAQQKASDAAQKWLGITDAEMEAIAQEFGERAVRIYAEDWAGGGAAVEREIRQTIADSVQQGDHVKAGKKRIAEALDRLGLSPVKSHVIETIVRTQTHTAYSAGNSAIDRLPVIDDVLWGYEYVAVGDDRTRPTHRALDGLRAPKDDPRWKSLTPPNGYNCRCTLIRIYKGDREAAANDPAAVEIQEPDGQRVVVSGKADPGFEFRPGDVLGRITGQR